MTNTVNALDVLQFMTHNDLRLYKKKNSSAPLNLTFEYEKQLKASNDNIGNVFVSRSKKDLGDGVGYVVTSYETLSEQRNQLSHWTPNTYRGGGYYDKYKTVMRGHTKDNLKQINVIGFDIDTKNVDLYGLFLGCDQLGLPRPNVLLETPKGYHGFFVLETPFYINKASDYKALRVASKLADNMQQALKQFVPVDTSCSPFGFYRIPNDQNILYFDDAAANTRSLIDWSIAYENKSRRSAFHVVYQNDSINHTHTEWYKALLQSTHIHKGYEDLSRNNTLLTLALANFASGVSYDEAFDELDQFNSQLADPLSQSEFRRTIDSAYSGRHKAPKRSYVEGLLEVWTDGVKYQGAKGWYKFKKNRKDRERSHYGEWEDDILQHLSEQTTTTAPYIECSLNQLAKEVGIPLSTLKVVLKKSNSIIKRTKGRGRASVTRFTTRAVMFKHLLHSRKQRRVKQLSFPMIQETVQKALSITATDLYSPEIAFAAEIDSIFRAGSPPRFYLSS